MSPLWVLGALLLGGKAAVAAPFNVSLSSATVAPGGVIKVFAALPDPSRASVSFRSRQYPFYRAGDRLRALIGITAQSETGSAELKVTQKRRLLPNKVAVFSVAIPGRKFREQALKMPKKKLLLTQLPEAKAALGAIRPSLRAETPQQRWRGTFALPVKARLSSSYGQTRRINKTKRWDWHKGVDLAASAGTPVGAPNDGVVALTGRYPLQGGTLVLDHGQGVTSLFLHLDKILVSPGQEVRKGQRLATVGTAGFSTGAHLHWGIYVHGDPVDPLPWLNQEL